MTQKASRTRTGNRAEEYVLEYFSRFRYVNEHNARGGGSQTKTDAQIMAELQAFSGDLDRSDLLEQSCEALRRFLIAYGVSRTFSGLSARNCQCLAPIVRHLQLRQEAWRAVSFDAVTEVLDLAETCVKAGFNRNMSFASKCLCMLGHAVPIYSSEGVAYLNHFGTSGGVKGYAAYCEAWLAAYCHERLGYEAAAARHLANAPVITEKLEQRLGVAWFAMRGYDVKMMAEGGPLRR